jgi:hypothetical protein
MPYEPTQALHLPVLDFLQLELHLMESRPDATPDTFVAGLVRRWLEIDKERLELRKNGQPMRGYQWKNVFLPDGTRLRTSYGDTTEFAKVVGDHLLADDGQRVTPSVFANRHTKRRSAWRCVWLRFPGDDYWSRAIDCRTRFNDQLRKQSIT